MNDKEFTQSMSQKTRRFEVRAKGDIVRRCRGCEITDDIIPFLVQKDSKTGRYNKHRLCLACYEERRRENRIKYYEEHRPEQIAAAKKWNTENRERYNKRRRKTFMEKWTMERTGRI